MYFIKHVFKQNFSQVDFSRGVSRGLFQRVRRWTK